MANTLSIQEVTIAQLTDPTHAINLVDTDASTATSPRKSVWQPIVCRVTDHDDELAVPATGDAADDMAIFKSAYHGAPWIKDQGLQHIVDGSGNGAGRTFTLTVSAGVITGCAVGGTLTAATRYPKTLKLIPDTGSGAILKPVISKAGDVTAVEVLRGGTGYNAGALVTAEIDQTCADDATVIFVNHDYSTFE